VAEGRVRAEHSEETPANSRPLNPKPHQKPKMKTPSPVSEKDGSPVLVTGAHSSAALQVGDRPAKRSDGPFAVFLPNRRVKMPVLLAVALIEAALFLLLWIFSPYKVLPQPMEVVAALSDLWAHQGLGQELGVSFVLNLEALVISTLLSLGLAYLTVIPAFRPVVTAVSKGRFLSLAGFTLIFTLMFGGGHPLKLALLTFAITVFFVTSMASVIAAIPRSEFEHARTLRMSEGRVVWEVVILGTADKAFEVLRQNAAMGWMMLASIEIISRGEGGIGTMLESERKFAAYAAVYAIQLLFLLVGMLQDYGIESLRRLFCPYSVLTLERK